MTFLQTPASGGGEYIQILFIGGMILVFYFFMIRPQQKKAKDAKVFRDSIAKGDNIVTIGGLHGKIVSIESDDTILVEVDKGVRLKFDKSSISMESTKKVVPAKTTV